MFSRIRAFFRRLRGERTLYVFKLGSLEHKMFPTQKAIDRLAEMLQNLPEDGGSIIWGPDLDVLKIDLDRNDSIVLDPVCPTPCPELEMIADHIPEEEFQNSSKISVTLTQGSVEITYCFEKDETGVFLFSVNYGSSNAAKASEYKVTMPQSHLQREGGCGMEGAACEA